MEGNQNPTLPGQNQSNQGQAAGSPQVGFGSSVPSANPTPAQPLLSQPSPQSSAQSQMPSPSSGWTPPSQSAADSSGMEPKNGSKRIKFLILIIIFTAAVAALVYVMLFKGEQMYPTPTPPPIIMPTATPSMTDEQEIESIDVGDVDTDLQEIETDLQSL